MINILLYAPEYRPNLSSMIRSAEFFGLQTVYLYDRNTLLEPPKNKATRADMNHLARVWTAGAIEHITIEQVVEPLTFLSKYAGRKVATQVSSSAQHLSQFQFQPNDLLLMGSEREGLPEAIIAVCDEAIYIPALGHTPCLNVAVSLGIILYAAKQQV
ncbi:MAG: TrmH family RNA methyltransferase, partial [Saprospiraceae bacterium]|nr:TrmH family RNA methyltransferase [Saprospiraceae bacterium]